MGDKKYKRFCKCKNCGKFAEVDDSVVLTSYPPQYSYYCNHCNNGGYVLLSETEIEEIEVDDIINEEKIIESKGVCLNGDNCGCAFGNNTSTIEYTKNYKIVRRCYICCEEEEVDDQSYNPLLIPICDGCKEAIKWAKRQLNWEKEEANRIESE